jgi:uncharacterized protein YkwD
LASNKASNLYSEQVLNLLDGVLLAAFALAVWDGARRGLSPYLAEFTAFVLSLAVAFAVFGPVAIFASTFAHVPTSAAAVGVFLLALAAAHGLAWPALHRWSAALESRLPIHTRRLGSVPALATALIAAAVVVAALAALPGQSQTRTLVQGSALGSRLAQAAAPLPMTALLGHQPIGQVVLSGRSGEDEDAFYRLTFPSGLKLQADSSAEARMLAQINLVRKRSGLRPLVMDAQLREVARAHSRDMYLRDYFSHVTPEGKTAFDRLQAAGVKFLAAGENIAFAPDVDSAEASLLSSPEHRANILAPDYVRVGIGVIEAPGYEEMFTQEFADSG